MKKLIFISAVSGVGKSTTCKYIKDNKLINNYEIYDIDDLENIHNYNENTYNLFYENAIKKAIIKSNNRNIILGSCINPNDIKKINIPNEIESYKNILITCSKEELRNRLKARDENRNCSSDSFIDEQIKYQNYMLDNIDLYDFNLNNTNASIEETAKQIVDYINN